MKNSLKFIILLLFSVSMAAQTDTLTKTINLDEVVISTGKFTEKKREVPYQVQLITPSKLRFDNNQTTADALLNTGNIFVQKSQMGGGSPVLRGFEANRVLIVVDGVRLNNAIYRAGHLQNVIRIDNNMLDRAEVVFGPNSVLYGSDALGGVMHFYTRTPQLSANKTKVNAGAFFRYASANNEKTGHVNFNIGTKKWGFLTSFTYSDFDDLRQGSNRRSDYPDFGKRPFYVERINNTDSAVVNKNPDKQVGTAYSQYDLLQKIRFRQNDKVNHTFNFQFSNTTDVPRYDRLTETSGGLPRFAQWYYGPEKRLLAGYQLQLDKGVSWFTNARLTLAYQNIEESRNSRRFNNPGLRRQVEKVQVWSANLDVAKNLSTNNTLRYGAEITYNNVNSSATSLDITTNLVTPWNTRYPDGGSTYLTSGLYLTNQHRMADGKLIASAGLRYSLVQLKAKFESKEFFPFPYSEANQTNNALNGNLGLVWLPAPTWKISLLGSTGFRAPNVDDLGKLFDSQPGTVFVPNPNLKPEYAWNAELGITKNLFGKLQLETTAFYTLLNNAIGAAPFTFNNQDTIEYDGVQSAVFAQVNNSSAYVTGVNAAMLFDVTNFLSLFASVNYTYGRINTDTTDYPLDHIPPIFGRAGVKLQSGKLKGEIITLFNGWKHIEDYNLNGEDNQQYATPDGMPAWFTLNLRTSYLLNKNFEVQAGIENLLDANYRLFASGVSAPGRNFTVTLRGNL
ncbi:TonB-dependent receptor [Sphingobacteriales bacterium UPWRP_1]|nr:TonB-dependent receptor [Sphingobacteriales bacterium TSM_CSS]PSJ74662.1 TonB-dependent receptor [Sphingobacteriales bacterium UPWRP_1]